MPLFSAPPITVPGRVISPWDENSLGQELGIYNIPYTITDRAWPLANLALLIPVHISSPGLTLMEGQAFCGTGAGGNFDIGLYSISGTRLTSSGATARTASTYVATTTMTNFPLPVGDYYMAMSCDGTTNFGGAVTVVGGNAEAIGICEAGSAYPLPSSLTPVVSTRTLIPGFVLLLRTTSV